MTTRKKLRVIHGGRASDAETLRSMKTYQLRMLLRRELSDHEERMVRAELLRRKAPANDPGKKHRPTSRVFRSKMEAIEFANEVLGPDYRVLSRMPGLMRLERKDNGAEFLIAWDGEERVPRQPGDPMAKRIRRDPEQKKTIQKGTWKNGTTWALVHHSDTNQLVITVHRPGDRHSFPVNITSDDKRGYEQSRQFLRSNGPLSYGGQGHPPWRYHEERMRRKAPANDPPRKKKGASRPRRLPGPRPTVTFAVFHPVTNAKKVFRGVVNKDKAHRQAVRWAKQYGKSVRLTLLSSNAFGARPFKVTSRGKWLTNQKAQNPSAPRRTKYTERADGSYVLTARTKKSRPESAAVTRVKSALAARRVEIVKSIHRAAAKRLKRSKEVMSERNHSPDSNKRQAAMLKKDAADMRAVASLVKAGRFAQAHKRAMYMDTEPRDNLPKSFWRFVEGEIQAPATVPDKPFAKMNKAEALRYRAAGRSSRRDPDEDQNDIILIMVYGSWGSELYSTAHTLAEAKKKALAASKKDPKNEYCVELEPGGFKNPLYKNGRKLQ